MVPFAGYDMPVQYPSACSGARTPPAHAGLFDVSHMGQVELHGADAAKALETLVPDVLGHHAWQTTLCAVHQRSGRHPSMI